MRCPHCQSEKQVTKNGWVRDGLRKYKCAACNKYFAKSEDRATRCECGLLKAECDGHTRFILYDDGMPLVDKYYRRRYMPFVDPDQTVQQEVHAAKAKEKRQITKKD